MKKIIIIVVFAFAATSLTAYSSVAEKVNGAQRNIIFMVPDGMGLSNVTATRIFKNGPNGDRLHFETLNNIGYQRTHSKNSTVTDSAAAASAWAVGEKFENGEISCHASADGSCRNLKKTILELAEEKGLATGIVATVHISHATPAAFGAHVISRKCGAEIARQFVEDTGIDVILGGGIYKTVDLCGIYEESFKAPDKDRYIVDKALANGYAYARTKKEMHSAVAGGSKKLLGMFSDREKTVEYFRVNGISYPAGEPTLAEMTAAALDILEEDEDGLFLVVEGSQIDWSNHGHKIEGVIAETLGFDAAVKVVLDWLEARPGRGTNTQIIVAADHDTGGFAVNGPYGRLSQGGDIVEGGWTSDKHTAVDTIVYSQGPLTQRLNKAVDNTSLYEVMENFLRY